MLIFVTPSHGPISIRNRLLPMFVVINTFDPERRIIFWFIRLKRAGLLCSWKEENSNNSELCTHAMDEHTLQMNASKILGIRVRTRAICLLWMNVRIVRIRLNVWFKNWFYNLPMCFKRANMLFARANIVMVWVYSVYSPVPQSGNKEVYFKQSIRLSHLTKPMGMKAHDESSFIT